MTAADGMMRAETETGYDHLIGSSVGDAAGPTLIAVGSVHGNEPAGALALEEVAAWLERERPSLRGRVYLVTGNLRAREQGVRFVDQDLNRAWTEKNVSAIGSPELDALVEGREMAELNRLFDDILASAGSEVYVIDLHSTSATGPPFATMGDTIRNRRFARKFPVRTLLGIEEQLEGTLLEHVNNLGAVTLGFEGGQHDSYKTVETHIAFAMLALANSGILAVEDLPDRTKLELRLADGLLRSQFYEVLHREAITVEDEFSMLPGFTNFDPVKKGDHLANNRHGPITASRSGVILMPLYQRLGEDGFFLGQRIAIFWLRLSALLRFLGFQNVVHWLPGISRDPNDEGSLIVNTRVARLFPLQVFHLLGFRRRTVKGSNIIVSRRRHDTTSPFDQLQ